MQIVGLDDRQRVFVTWQAAVLGAVLALVLGGALGASVVDDRAPSAAEPAPAAVGEADGCADAVDRASVALDVARDVEQALTRHVDVVNDLRAGRIAQAQALERVLPSLTEGAESSVELDVQTQLFLQAAGSCPR